MNKVSDPQDLEDIKSAIADMEDIVSDVKRLLELSGHLFQYGKAYQSISGTDTVNTLLTLNKSFTAQIEWLVNTISSEKK